MTVAFVDDQATSTSGGSTKTLALTFATPFAAGDTVIVVTAYETETNTAVVTDGAGNTYQADTANIDAGLHWITQWHRFDYVSIPGTSSILLTLANGVASKGVWANRYTGIKKGAAIQTVWNKQVAPGTASNGLVTTPITLASQPALSLAISMSKTGTAGALATTGTPGFTNRAASWTFAGGSGSCARMEEKRLTSVAAFQSTFTAGVGTDTYISGLLILPEAPVTNPYKVNPAGFAYQSVTGVGQYANKSGMLITGRGNRYDAAFTDARSKGAEILAYLDAAESPSVGHTLGGLDDIFYQVVGGVPGAAPWPYTANGTFGTTPGANRVNFANTYMTDITVGSAWIEAVIAYAENLMREDKVDGVFWDVSGGRLFSILAAWGLLGSTGDWTQPEMNAWTAGNVELMRRLDVSRRAINPRFILMNNNTWDTGDALNNGFLGEPYVDGVSIEHHPPTSSYHVAYAGKQTFSNLGHRRFLEIASSTSDAILWAATPGVTDVSDQHGGGAYNAVSPPPISFTPVNDRVAPAIQLSGMIKCGNGVFKFGKPNTVVSTAVVPNIVSEVKATAESDIVAAGFIVGAESSQTSGSVASGSVISQSPLAGATANVGSAINLVISSGATGFPLLRSNTVTGSDKSAQTGYISPNGFVHDDGTARQGGRIYPITVTGRYWLRLETLLGDNNSRNITVSLFASTNTVANTHFTAITNQVVSFADGEVGEKGIAIDILAIPTGMGLVGVTLGGNNPHRTTCWLWLQGSGHVAGATYVQTSNGTNAHGLTTGAGTSGNPYNSIEYAAAQLGDTGGIIYVKYNGSHKEYTAGAYGSNPGGQGIKLPNLCSNTAPLVILPDPDNATPLTLNQGVTGAGGSSVLFSNATGFDWNGIQGTSIFICGFNLLHCNYSFYGSSGACTDIVIWQSEQSLFASDQSNAAGVRADSTESLIVQDVYSHENYSTENGGNANPFDSVPAKIYEGVHAFSPSNLSVVHCKFHKVQNGVYLKDTGVNTSPDISHNWFGWVGNDVGGNGNAVSWPQQGGTANYGVMRYCVADATGSPVTQGHMFSSGGGGSSQYSYVDIYNCVQIGNNGLLWDFELAHARVFNCVSQSATNVEIVINNAGALVSSLEASNYNLFVSSTHGFTVNGVNYANLTAWKAAATNAFLLSAPDQNSTTTNTPPSYTNTINHDYTVTINGGRGGAQIGIGQETAYIMNNFLNSSLPTT